MTASPVGPSTAPPKASSAAAQPAAQEDFPEDPRFRTMRRLVNLLLIVLIAGALSVVIALLLKLKETNFTPYANLTALDALEPNDQLVGFDASSDQIALVIEDVETGDRRLLVLDGGAYRLRLEVQRSDADAGATAAPE